MAETEIQIREAKVEDVAARGLYEKLGFTNEEGPQATTMLYYELQL